MSSLSILSLFVLAQGVTSRDERASFASALVPETTPPGPSAASDLSPSTHASWITNLDSPVELSASALESRGLVRVVVDNVESIEAGQVLQALSSTLLDGRWTSFARAEEQQADGRRAPLGNATPFWLDRAAYRSPFRTDAGIVTPRRATAVGSVVPRTTSDGSEYEDDACAQW